MEMRMLSSRRIACFKTLTRVISRKWSNWEENCISWQTFEQFQLSDCSAAARSEPRFVHFPQNQFSCFRDLFPPMLHILQGNALACLIIDGQEGHLKSLRRAVELQSGVRWLKDCQYFDRFCNILSRIVNILKDFGIFSRIDNILTDFKIFFHELPIF